MTRATARTDVRPAAPERAAVRTPVRPAPNKVSEPRPELRLVPTPAPVVTRRPRRGLKNRRAPFVLLVVALLVGTTLGLLILNTAIAVDSLKATQLRTENAQREQDIQRLERQVVDGSTPGELAGEAADAGLVPAGPPAYLVIEPDGSSTVRGTPEPAPDPAAADPDGEG